MGRSLQEYTESRRGARFTNQKKPLSQAQGRSASLNAKRAQEEGNKLHPGQGTVLTEGGTLTPEQQFEMERRALDPLTQDTAITNPYSKTDHRTQRAMALMGTNRDLARSAYGMVPGEDAYTIQPTDYEQMGWSPDEKYAYEDQIDQTRGDTTGLDAQTKALQGYQDITNQGGLTDIDRAAIMQSHMGREQELRANRQAIMQNAQEQGRAGGNAQLMAQMQAAQGTANLRAMDDLRTNALGLERRDQALGAMGSLGGQVQSAQDSIDRFNAEGNRARQERNVVAKNKGIDTKYQDEQDTNRANVEVKNSAEQLNKSEGYGQRGRYADQVGAIQGIQQANLDQAGFETQRQDKILAERQQKKANKIGGAQTLVGGGIELAKPFMSK